MARLPYPNLEQLPADARAAVQTFPKVINAVRMAAHAPTLVAPLRDLVVALLTRLALPARLRELVILAVAHETRCHYEWVQHLPQAVAAGVTSDDLAVLTDRSRLPEDPAERLVLAAIRDHIHSPEWPEAALVKLTTVLDPRQIVELLLLIGAIRMFCLLINTLAVDLDPAGEELAAGFAALAADEAKR